MKRKLKYFAIFLAIVFGFAGFAGIMAKKNSQSTYAINSTSGYGYGSSVNDGLSFDGEGNLVVTFTVTSTIHNPDDDLYHHGYYLYLYDASEKCPSYDAESHLVTEELTYIRDEAVLEYGGYFSYIGYNGFDGTFQIIIDGDFSFYHSHFDSGVHFDYLLNAEHGWKVYVGAGYGDGSYEDTTFAVDLYVGTIDHANAASANYTCKGSLGYSFEFPLSYVLELDASETTIGELRQRLKYAVEYQYEHMSVSEIKLYVDPAGYGELNDFHEITTGENSVLVQSKYTQSDTIYFGLYTVSAPPRQFTGYLGDIQYDFEYSFVEDDEISFVKETLSSHLSDDEYDVVVNSISYGGQELADDEFIEYKGCNSVHQFTYAATRTKKQSSQQEEELSITFRPVVVDEREVDNLRVYENSLPGEVVVQYYVTLNDGVNSFVLIPSYNKDVFTLLDTQNNPRVQVGGNIDTTAVTITGNIKDANQAEFVKIAYDSSTVYNASHEYHEYSDENVVLLTLTFTTHDVPTNYGHYDYEFGLVLNEAGKTNNTSSVAYKEYAKTGEQSGDLQEVLIKLEVDENQPENVIDLYIRQATEIVMSKESGESYAFGYNKEPVSIYQVNWGSDFTNLITSRVEYRFSGVAEQNVVYTWKDSTNTVLSSAPSNAGTYTVTISASATDAYAAPAPQTRTVTILPAQVSIKINDYTQSFGVAFNRLGIDANNANHCSTKNGNGLFGVSGFVYGTDEITFDVIVDIPTSNRKVADGEGYEEGYYYNAGVYEDKLAYTNLAVNDGNNGNNYVVNVTEGTYTVEKYQMKVWLSESSISTTFNGGLKYYGRDDYKNIAEYDHHLQVYYGDMDADGYSTTLEGNHIEDINISFLNGLIEYREFETNMPTGYAEDYDFENDDWLWIVSPLVPVGTYTITPYVTFDESSDANNFDITVITSTYKITPCEIDIVPQTVVGYYGNEASYYPAPTLYNVVYHGTTNTISSELTKVLGTVSLSVTNFPATGFVPAGTYTIASSYNSSDSNFTVHTLTGVYQIHASDLTEAERNAIRAAFGIVEVTYDAEGHQMWTFDASGLPLGLDTNSTGYSVSAEINGKTATDKVNVGTYPVTITFTITDETINSNRNTNENPSQNPITVVFEVKQVVDEVDKYSKIAPKAVTIPGTNGEHTFGSYNTAFSTNGTVSTGVKEETVNVYYVVKDSNNQTVTLSNTTPAGTYKVVTTAAQNPNYVFTCNDGTYTVNKATPTLSIIVMDTNYSDHLYLYERLVTVGNLNNNDDDDYGVYGDNYEYYDGFEYVVNIYDSNNQLVVSDANQSTHYWLDAGEYSARLVLTGTDNYNGATSDPSYFTISKVELVSPSISFNKNKATWGEVTSDNHDKGIKEGVTLKYYINNVEVEYDELNERFECTATSGDNLYLEVVADDSNYISYTRWLIVRTVTFVDGGNHGQNYDDEGLTLPEEQYVFDGQKATVPTTTPTLVGYTFNNYEVVVVGAITEPFDFNTAIEEDTCILVTWTINSYTVTFKYYDEANEADINVFTKTYHYRSNITFGEDTEYGDVNLNPQKPSTNVGISYVFNGTWNIGENSYFIYDEEWGPYVFHYLAYGENHEYYEVTSNVTLVAQYNQEYNTFTITYYTKEADGEYTQFGETQEVVYGSAITYRTLTNNVTWFTAKAWFANEAATEAAPTTMPSENINVYGLVAFDIGTGDVNGDGFVDSNDITLYRQWIVGGYEMTVVQAGKEWETATSNEFDFEHVRYYLVRVANTNGDQSTDIRDVSVTRMSIVGGYTWRIRTGLNVSGQEIKRDDRVKNYDDLVSTLDSGSLATLVSDVSAENSLTINTNKNVYINLNGKTLTLTQLSITLTDEHTITIENGTIVTTNGVLLYAPNGNVVLTDVTAYDANGEIQLAAGSHSLHVNGLVKFFMGSVAAENPTPAPVKVEKGTHVVVEKASNVVVEKLVVTKDKVVSDAEDAVITIDNNSLVYETVQVQGNVVVDNDVEIDTLEELVAAGNKGGEFTLNADIDVNGYVLFTKNATLNLNGHTIYNSTDIWSDEIWSLISVGAETLTINGEGSLLAKANDCYAVDVWGGANLVINGGNYVGNIHAVYVYEGTLTVNGGNFSIQQLYPNGDSYGYVLNCWDTNYKLEKATIVVKGGSFDHFNPADCAAESPRGHFVPAEYYVVEAEDVYTVLPKTYVSTEAELVAAVANDNYVVLNADIDLTAELIIENVVTLDLNDHRLFNTTDIWDDDEGIYGLIGIAGGYLTVNGDGEVIAKENDCYAVEIWGNGTLVVNGGTFGGNCHAVYLFKGTAIVNGGYFYVQQVMSENPSAPYGYVLNCLDERYQSGVAHIIVNGGSFENFNPGDCAAEGAHTNFLGEGHTVTSQVVEENTIYTVA